MLPTRLVRATAARHVVATACRLPIVQRRTFMPREWTERRTIDAKYPDYPTLDPAEDPEMNGGYINPPPIKRQHRDPTANWWDKQERRNFGEPIHEDNDLLGIMSTWEYNWTTTTNALVSSGVFLATFAGVVGAIYYVYPDRPDYPKEYEDGLRHQLGGSEAILARKPRDPFP